MRANWFENTFDFNSYTQTPPHAKKEEEEEEEEEKNRKYGNEMPFRTYIMSGQEGLSENL
jgi:hypothetical protein